MKRQIAALAACLVSLASMANEVRYFNDDQMPSATEIASLLAPPAARPTEPSGLGGRTRLIRMMDNTESPQVIGARAQPAPTLASPAMPAAEPQAASRLPLQVAKTSSVGSVAMALRFGIDAIQIHPNHLARLDALAEGIKRLPEGAIVTIAGHTDAFGSAAYNFDLSLQRALAVRAYLVRVHGIPAARLVATGKGKSEPLNRANPYAPENRRVQVHAEYDLA